MAGMDGTTAAHPAGIPREVAAAAVATAVGALPLVPAFAGESVPTGALYLIGWPALGVVAAILLDRDPGSRLGRVLTVLALVPAILVALAAMGGALPALWARLEVLSRGGDVVILLLALAPIAWAVGLAPDRMSRRRLAWVTGWAALLTGAVAAASLAASSRTLGLVTTLGLCGLAGVLLRLETATEFRPLDEPLVDVATVLCAAAPGVAAGTAVRAVVAGAGLPLPDVSAVFAAVLVAALAWPLALRLRGLVLQRRYGTGVLAPDAVAEITADLRHDADPRALLDRAARMIAVASGHPQVTLHLGAGAPDPPPGWTVEALVVGGDRVGSLLVRPRHPEGPEARQKRAVAQLLPTVALMTRAVGLAVEAEEARHAVAQEREAERRRILDDLHDGLGPVLAGMGMRVQAELRRRPTPLLRSLAAELADARDDLRGMVSDLAPSALDGAGLADALGRLVAGLDGSGARVLLDVDLADEPSPQAATAVYRSVAEGVTNAIRHGRAEHVHVCVRGAAGAGVEVEVLDDGRGGPVVAGTGLTSLRRRAEHLGGRLLVGPGPSGGIHLRVQLPPEGAP